MLHSFTDSFKYSQSHGRYSVGSTFIQAPPKELMKPLPPLPPCAGAIVQALRDATLPIPPSPSDLVLGRNKVSLLLDGQNATAYTPLYHPGDTIDGIILIPRPSSLLALDVRILGTIKVDCDGAQEGHPGPSVEARCRSYDIEVLKELVFFWNAELDGSFPERISFRYNIPKDYEDAGERYPLPPSYAFRSARTSRDPPFRVTISYEIDIDMLREKEPAAFWRRNHGLRVPLLLHPNTRPPSAGPFPLQPIPEAQSNDGPQTLFTFEFEPGDLHRPLIRAHVYLPASQVCTLSEPIPFFITLFGADEDLAAFRSHTPSVASFHPLSSPPVPTPFRARSTLPVCLKLQRTTVVYTHRATAFAHTQARTHDTRVIGRGVVQRSTRGCNSVTWAGSIVVDPALACGGFDVGRVKVVDSIVLSVNVRDPRILKSVKKFREYIPVRLTTKPFDCPSATKLAS